MRDYFKTIVISDVHLGTKVSKIKALNNFLKHHKCDHLIINGDLYGDKKSVRKEYWKKKHFKFFARINKMMELDNTRVTIIKGINEELLEIGAAIVPQNVEIVNELILESGQKRFLVLHGDIYNHLLYRKNIATSMVGKMFGMMSWLGKNVPGLFAPFSPIETLGSIIPTNKFKEFEEYVSQLAKKKGCHGVICGNTHEPAIKKVNGIEYLNSGDWISSMSALVEDEQGRWNLCFNAESKIPKEGSNKSPKASRTLNIDSLPAA